LGAEVLVLLSNVPGLLERFPDETSLVPSIAPEAVGAAIDLAQGRMKKKVLAAKEALEAGVARIVLGDARRAEPIRAALRGAGTVIG
jgi:acetylglutamate/LysW-gamma-L-alpha-aminoadipate kinase